MYDACTYSLDIVGARGKTKHLLTVTNFFTNVAKFVARAAFGTEMKINFHLFPHLLS